MKKIAVGLVLMLLGLALLSACVVPTPAPETIKIGINAPITGDIPKVGEGTKFAAEMWLEDINAAGGLEVGGKKYQVELVIEDNESKGESAAAVNSKLITQDEVLVIVGPQASKQAVPAGGVANDNQTPMVSPWSTNPNTTLDRPWVFRTPFLDPFQGPVVANFVTEEFGFTKAAVLYDVASDYPKGLADFFKQGLGRSAWPRFRRGLRELHHRGRRLQRPDHQDQGVRRRVHLHASVLQRSSTDRAAGPRIGLGRAHCGQRQLGLG